MPYLHLKYTRLPKKKMNGNTCGRIHLSLPLSLLGYYWAGTSLYAEQRLHNHFSLVVYGWETLRVKENVSRLSAALSAHHAAGGKGHGEGNLSTEAAVRWLHKFPFLLADHSHGPAGDATATVVATACGRRRCAGAAVLGGRQGGGETRQGAFGSRPLLTNPPAAAWGGTGGVGWQRLCVGSLETWVSTFKHLGSRHAEPLFRAASFLQKQSFEVVVAGGGAAQAALDEAGLAGQRGQAGAGTGGGDWRGGQQATGTLFFRIATAQNFPLWPVRWWSKT